jgi:signal transduction histidine kinase
VLAVVSHDLRNPISAIAMCARVLTESPPESESERRRTLGAITEATDWANRLIEDLLDMASIEAGTLSIERTHETVPLLVQSAVGILEGQIRERGHEVIVNVAHGISSLHADAGRIVQVLSNLLGNAVKFTPPGGRITIHVDAADGQTRFRVSDTGPGIPPEEATLVFQRYWHVRRGAGKRGSGLGLAIARGIVDAHGGRIWLESEPGKGASFIFTIPDEVPLQ